MNLDLLTTSDIDRLEEKLDSINRKMESIVETSGRGIFYSIPEVCKLLKVSPRCLQKWRDNGKISYTKIGAKIYFTGQDIQESLAKHRYEIFNKKGVRG